MSTDTEQRLLKQFDIYAHKFDLSDEHLERKFLHSKRVMERAKEIAKSEQVTNSMLDAAIVAGLLHDYSRFTQWAKYHTFRDAISIDHADEAARLLFDNGEIANFYANKDNYNIIYQSIQYHNKYVLPADLTGDALFLTRLVRDADKLDIIEILTWNKHLLAESSDPISPSVEATFFANKMIDSHDAKTGNDWILLSLAMLYDLNFPYSFQYVLDKNLLPQIFHNLTDQPRFQKYFTHINHFIEQSQQPSKF